MDSGSIFIYTLVLMGILGLVGAVVLYLTAKKFKVVEDSRIDEIESLLPGANCGACGCKGCRDFAGECVRRGNLNGMNCPGAGSEAMTNIAAILGVTSSETVRKTAVLRCNGSYAQRPAVYEYDGAHSCAVMDCVGCGTSGCSYGCLGCGDCVAVCSFGAIALDSASGLPSVDPAACTGCGVCVKECPRHILELRPAGRHDRRVWVACASRDKGAQARKNCKAACIGCGKCASVCPFAAISVTENLAYIDPEKCKACGKCIGVCPTGAILSSFKIPQSDKASE